MNTAGSGGLAVKHAAAVRTRQPIKPLWSWRWQMRDQCWATTPLQPCGLRRRRWHLSKSSAPSQVRRGSRRFVIDKVALCQMISCQCTRSNGACCTTCEASRCSRMCRENTFSRIETHIIHRDRETTRKSGSFHQAATTVGLLFRFQIPNPSFSTATVTIVDTPMC